MKVYMRILVDNRETALIEQLGKTDVTLKNLEVGDIVFESDEGNLLLIIERKTIDDLFASFKDGRYKEQSFRLNALEEINNHNIFYLIEGKIDQTNNSSVFAAMFSLNFFKGFSVIRSLNVVETATIIKEMAKQIQKKGTENPSTSTSYSSVLNKAKKSKNIQPDNFGEIVLSQIPGVSSTIAITIMNHYKSFQALLQDENKKTTLENLKINDKRKINKPVVETICKFLTTW
jgi:ERCC4-type nuclease